MRHIFLICLLLLAPLSRSAQAQNADSGYVRVPFNLTLVPGIGIGDMMADAAGMRVINVVSFNILAGQADRLEGVEFGGIWNGIREDVFGVQYAGVANTVGGNVQGVQFAGVANIAQGTLSGAQFAGVANVVHGDAAAIQSAGVVNVVKGTMTGIQFSGVVNVARDARGVQFGVVNVAETNTGVPIGLVSYVRDYGLRYDLWVDEMGVTQVAVRSGNRKVANYFGVASRTTGSSEEGRFGIVAGLGYEQPLSPRSFLMVDGMSTSLLSDNLDEDTNLLVRLRLAAGLNLSDHFALFAGPTLNLYLTNEGDAEAFAPYKPLTGFGDEDVNGAMWVGFVAGLRLIP